ncbi:MAG TPA: response regulator transcription factor [Novosphingobium sp.]|nr:response regulator transcription factor [Novosphingobium sp.]
MPTLTGTKTLLVTSPDPALARSVAAARPDLRFVPLDARIDPALPIDGPAWCFVDWLLPDTSGLEVVRRLREARGTREAHITMVLDDHDSEERRRALKAGADDYMTGPLSAAALLARMAQYETAGSAAGPARSRLVNGDLAVDLAAHQLRYRGTPIALRPNEFRLLVHFMEHPDQVFSRQALIERLGKDEEAIDERTVDVWVGRLRRALAAHGAPDPLRTVRALGYVMDSSAP